MTDEFCIVCGSPPPIYEGRLCEDCLRKRTHLSKISDRIQQNRCSKCNLHQIGVGWANDDDLAIAERRIRENLVILADASDVDLQLSVETIDERSSRINIDVRASVFGLEFSDSHMTLLQTSDVVCQTCSRKDGAYFEAEFQIRSTGRKLSADELSEVRATLDEMLGDSSSDPMFFVTKEGPVQGGWDLQLGSKSMARIWSRKLIQRFGGSAKETSTVIGVKDGSEVTRLTISYRKPAFSIGDVMRLKKSVWIVVGWQKDGPILGSLKNNQRVGKTWRDMGKSSVICSNDDQLEVQILNKDESAADVMIPVDWNIATVALPFDYEGESTLRIGMVEDSWVALPYSSKGGGPT